MQLIKYTLKTFGYATKAVTSDIIILLCLLPCILIICTNPKNRFVYAWYDESINK